MTEDLEQAVKEYCDILDTVYDIELKIVRTKGSTYGLRALLGDFGPEVAKLEAEWEELKPQVFPAYYKMRRFVKTDLVDEPLLGLTEDEIKVAHVLDGG